MPWHEPLRRLQLHEEQMARDFKSFKSRIIVALIIIALGCTWGIFQNRQLFTKFNNEAKSRRAQTCDAEAKAFNQKIDNIETTYRYLNKLPLQEKKSTLNQFVIASIPKSYSDALSSRPPAFCKNKLKTVPPLKDYLPAKVVFLRDYPH